MEPLDLMLDIERHMAEKGLDAHKTSVYDLIVSLSKELEE
jgi:hypothetical protein